MPPKETPETVVAEGRPHPEFEKGRKVGYEEGYQAGLLAGRPKLTLFEAAKKAARETFAQPVEDLHARIDQLEREYVEEL